MAKQSINAVLDKQQANKLISVSEAQLEALNRIEAISLTDRIIQIAQVVEEHKIQDDEDLSLDETKDINKTLKIIEANTADNYLLQVEQNDILSNIEQLVHTLSDSVISSAEDRVEDKRRQDVLLGLQEQLVRNTTPVRVRPTQESEDDGPGLGSFVTRLAIALGALIGVVSAYVKRIQFFVKLLTPKLYAGIIESISKIGSEIKAVFTVGFTLLKAVLNAVMEIGFNELKKIFTFGEGSKIGKIFAALKTAVTTFIEPFADAIKVIKELMSGSNAIGKTLGYITETLGAIGKGFLEFGSKIGKIAGIVGKLFLPLTIIMSVWDTVKGAMAGFEKDGIIGGITGAIKGLINSVIMGPADMLKDIASWIAEQFGMDSVSKFLDSFSFTDIFDKIMDAITHPIEALKGFFGGAVDSFAKMIAGIGIPEFTIPVPDWMGGPVTMGPWYPFKDEQPTKAAPEGTKTTNEPTKVETPKAKKGTNEAWNDAGENVDKNPDIYTQHERDKAAKKSGVDYIIKPEVSTPDTSNAVYNKSAENEGSKEDMTSKGSGSTIVSAPTVNTSNQTVNKNVVRVPATNLDRTYNSYIKYVS